MVRVELQLDLGLPCLKWKYQILLCLKASGILSINHYIQINGGIQICKGYGNLGGSNIALQRLPSLQQRSAFFICLFNYFHIIFA